MELPRVFESYPFASWCVCCDVLTLFIVTILYDGMLSGLRGLRDELVGSIR